MNISLELDSRELNDVVFEKLNAARVPCQDAMADRVYEIVDSNIGNDGKYRPKEWEQLRSARYAKKQGRSFATLHQDVPPGGELRASVYPIKGGEEYAEVTTDCKYAATHQFGDESRNIAERPFFPFINGEVTDLVKAECMQVCEDQLNELLNK